MNLKAITSPFLGPSRSKVPSLTPREIEIINLIRLGKTSKQIGTQLRLGKATIDFHRDRIRRKLGLTSDKADLRTYLLSLTILDQYWPEPKLNQYCINRLFPAYYFGNTTHPCRILPSYCLRPSPYSPIIGSF